MTLVEEEVLPDLISHVAVITEPLQHRDRDVELVKHTSH